MINLTFRDAIASDLPHIQRLTRGLAEYENLLDHAMTTDADFHALMSCAWPRAYAVLAEPAAQPTVGIALLYYTISRITGRSGLFLEDLLVECAFRGFRIGLALMHYLAQYAVGERCAVWNGAC